MRALERQILKDSLLKTFGEPSFVSVLSIVEAYRREGEDYRDTLERLVLHEALLAADGQQNHAAELVQLHPATFSDRIKARGALRRSLRIVAKEGA